MKGKAKFSKKKQIRKFRKKQFKRATIYGNPIEPFRYVKMRYNTSLTISSITGTVGYNVYRLNSIFDPDYSNGGTNHQPIGHDQLATLYNRYCVIGCSIVIRASASSNCMMTVNAKLDPTAPTNLELEAERGRGKEMYVNDKTVGLMKNYFSTASVFGTSKRHITSDDYYSGAMGSNPSKVCYLVVSIQHPDRVSTVYGYCNIELCYYVKLDNRIDLTGS